MRRGAAECRPSNPSCCFRPTGCRRRAIAAPSARRQRHGPRIVGHPDPEPDERRATLDTIVHGQGARRAARPALSPATYDDPIRYATSGDATAVGTTATREPQARVSAAVAWRWQPRRCGPLAALSRWRRGSVICVAAHLVEMAFQAARCGCQRSEGEIYRLRRRRGDLAHGQAIFGQLRTIRGQAQPVVVPPSMARSHR
jgi:hypothetical protein